MNTPRWKIPVEEVPLNQTVHQYLLLKTDLAEQIKKFSAFTPTQHIQVPLKFDISLLKADLTTLLNQYPAYSFPFGVAPVDNRYQLVYLTYNPRSINTQISNYMPTPKSNYPDEKILGDHFGKNSYDDSLAISTRTHFAEQLSLKTFLDSFSRMLVRAKVVVHSGLACQQEASSNLSWHTDENIFINTRLNIPLFSNDNFAIEYLTSANPDTGIQSFDLLEGSAFCVNTGLPHRFVSKQAIDFSRISLICGFSPWFDFDTNSQSWVSNEFYGKLHPFEIVARGLVTPYLGSA